MKDEIIDDASSLSHQLASNYADYLKVDTSGSRGEVSEEVSGLQKLMDELYTTLLTVQESNEEVLLSRLPTFLEKARELEGVFTQIDVVASSVSSISANLQQLENAANAIDKQVDTNPFKKVFGYFRSSSQQEKEVVIIPNVFSSEQLLGMEEGSET